MKQPVTPIQYISYYLEQALNACKQQDGDNVKNLITKAFELSNDLDPYIEKYSTQASPILDELVAATKHTKWQELFQDSQTKKALNMVMMSGQHEALFLDMMIRIAGARRVLEIGMFTGCATLAMAAALPDDGYIITCDNEPYLIEFTKPFFTKAGYNNKIDIRIGDAIDTLNNLEKEHQKFDLIFIDANKMQYSDYYSIIMEKELLTPGGIMCVDNTLMGGGVYAGGAENIHTDRVAAIVQFNELVANDVRVEQMILPVRDGVTIIRSKKDD